MGMNIFVSCPKGFQPDKSVVEQARRLAKEAGGVVELVPNPQKAAEAADILYTDVWVSMGQEKGAKKKELAFKPFQVNAKLVAKAKDDVAVMHCLPAHRGLEITDDVLEGPRSVVWKQAENKLHGARAVLAAFIGVAE
jgi:ornithine carbamoyltransferase